MEHDGLRLDHHKAYPIGGIRGVVMPEPVNVKKTSHLVTIDSLNDEHAVFKSAHMTVTITRKSWEMTSKPSSMTIVITDE